MQPSESTLLTSPEVRRDATVEIRSPLVTDGADIWRIARDSQTLDLNSSYAYILYARDFSDTCRVAKVDEETAGFVIGYRRPERQDCLFVWQVAVDERFRGLGLAARMLDSLVEEAPNHSPVRTLETTITEDNSASQRLFRKFAHRWDAERVNVRPLFEEDHFPSQGDHDPEPLYEIGPLNSAE